MFATLPTAGRPTALLVLGCLATALAQGYSVGTDDEIRESAQTLAYDAMLFYDGNSTGKTPGLLPGPPSEGLGDYYWYQAATMMSTLVDYWHLTGDGTYNDVVAKGLLHQAGKDRNYMPANQTATLVNDDQGFWGMAAMLAAEHQFPAPDNEVWLPLAQAVWNTQVERLDDRCGGGLAWAISPEQLGYQYKNTVSNAVFFNLGAPLARYTGNSTYLRQAEATWDWLWALEYIDHKTWRAYDGAHSEQNCTDVNKATFSTNIAFLTQGAAFIYNHTQEEKWLERTNELVGRFLQDFFPEDVAYEVPCEAAKGRCTGDMIAYKGYAHRLLAVVTQLVPSTSQLILPVLQKSAEAAVEQCTGGDSGRACGFYWSLGEYVDPEADGTTGAGEALNVLAAVSSLLIDGASSPMTNATGTSTEAGDSDSEAQTDNDPATSTNSSGAATFGPAMLASGMGTLLWMFL
ncbi:glycosyl hydrolase family 76 [Verticillium dahliae]